MPPPVRVARQGLVPPGTAGVLLCSGRSPPSAADPDARLVGTVAAEDDAERMPGRVGEDPEARFAFTRDASGTQGEQVPLRLAGVAHTDVQVHLLGVRRVGPARRNPVGRALESKLPRPGPEPMTTQPPRSSLILMPSTSQ